MGCGGGQGRCGPGGEPRGRNFFNIPEGRNITYLHRMRPGQKGRVVGFADYGPLTRRLMELGLVPGRVITYIRNAPLNDPLEISIGSSRLSLRHYEASLVAVELEE